MQNEKDIEELADVLQGALHDYTGQYDDREIFLRMARYAIRDNAYTKRPQDNNIEIIAGICPECKQELFRDNNLVPLPSEAELAAASLPFFRPIAGDKIVLDAYEFIRFIHAKFGKDNSGMDLKQLETLLRKSNVYGFDSNCEFKKAEVLRNQLANLILSKLSQQPPKERKVSLEEIEEVLRSNGEIKHIPVSGDLVFGYLKPIAQAILSLINATEERKGE